MPDITVSTLGKRSVAVMFFDNQSGNPDLDWLREGLAGMLITDLSRSRNLAVLSRQQLHLLLERIGHNASEGIRLDEALELAQRSQAQIVILGSFARLGEQIRLDVQLHDARDGHLLTAERLVVNQPEQILTQLDLLSLKLASHLGSRSEEQTDRNATVMTNNLEAYRYYSLGVEKSRALQTQEAIALLEKAVQLDPEFAMAYARIGYTYVLTSARIDEGKPYLEKAFKLTHRLSEYDRLNISAWYALANQDYEAAIKSFRDIIERYPLEVEAYQRLGRLLHGEDRFDEAVEILKQGLVIDPGAKELYNSLGSTYSDMGHHDDAIPTYQHYVQLAAQEPNSHDSLGLGYEGAGRYNEAIEEYERALSIKPDFQVSTIHLANALTRLGRYREAIEKYRRFNELVQVPRERSRGYTSIARVQVLRGNLVDAEKAARQANLQEKQSVDGFLFVAFAKADQAMAKRALETYETSNHPDRGSRFSLRRVLYYRGQVALLERRHEEAIALFKDALRHRPLIWDGDAQEDCLANAYLTLGMLDESTAEYERILKLNPNYPLVHYHLGQIYERKGQREKARAEYQQFLTVWEKADADIPEVVAAKKVLGSA